MRGSDIADPFEMLGLPGGASEAEIKEAFRRIAKDIHPDTSGLDGVVDMDRLVSARNDALDMSRRRAAEGQRHTPSFGSGYFDDVIDKLNAHTKGRHDGRPDLTGADLEIYLPIPLEMFKTGGTIPHVRPCDCPQCKPEVFTECVCRVCGGDGIKTSVSGVVSIELTCRSCRGDGTVSRDRAACISPGRRPVVITVPPNSEPGRTLLLRGQGMPGPSGRGDFIVHLSVKPEERRSPENRQREPHARVRGFAISVSLYEAACGGRIQADLDGIGLIEIRLPPGTQSGKIFKYDGPKGAVDIVVNVEIPDASKEPLRSIFEDLRSKL